MRRRLGLYIAASLGFFEWVTPGQGFAQYIVTNLSALLPQLQFAPQATYATAINGDGQALIDTTTGATFYSQSERNGVTEVGPPPSEDNSPFDSGNAINRNDEVVGSQNGAPLIFSNGSASTIPGVTQGDAVAVNDAGTVVGDYYTGSNWTAFSYSGSTLTNLGFNALNSLANSEAYEINSTGEIVGVSNGVQGADIAGNPFGVVAGLDSSAFIIKNGQVTDLYALLNGDFDATGSCATSVNDAGTVVGYFQNSGGVDAFLYDGTDAYDLGHLSESSTAIANLEVNDAGATISDLYDNRHGAFLNNGDGFVEMNTLIDPGSGWTLLAANGINDLGQIVGYGIGPDGNTDAYLLTPAPEPPGGVFAALGMSALLGRKRRH